MPPLASLRLAGNNRTRSSDNSGQVEYWFSVPVIGLNRFTREPLYAKMHFAAA